MTILGAPPRVTSLSFLLYAPVWRYEVAVLNWSIIFRLALPLKVAQGLQKSLSDADSLPQEEQHPIRHSRLGSGRKIKKLLRFGHQNKE